MMEFLTKHLKKEWKYWITTSIAILGLIILFIQTLNVPNAEDVAVRLSVTEVAGHINMDKLAEIIVEKSGAISNADLNAKKAAIPIPPRKPKLIKENNKIGMTKINAACLVLAAQTYNVPPSVLVGIYDVERGELGKEYGPQKDGSYEIGLMKINSKILPMLADKWSVKESTARSWLQFDPCTNMGVAAWKLRESINETGSLAKAIAKFRYDNDKQGHTYKGKVVDAMRDKGLLKDSP